MTKLPDISSIKCLEDALELCSEIKQDLILENKIIYEGHPAWRELGELILKVVESGESVLELGASFSYFGQLILSQKENCCYLGIEKDVASSYIAGKVIDPFKSGVVLHSSLEYETLKMLDDSCTIFDVVILGSLINQLSSDHFTESCAIIDRISPKIIFDLESIEESVAQDIFSCFRTELDALKTLFPTKDFEQIAVIDGSPVFMGTQKGGKNNYKKTARDPYIGKISNERKYFIRGDKMIKQNLLNPHNEVVVLQPGFSLWDWSMCGKIMSPSKEKISQQAIEKFKQLPKTATDIRPWNMIWSAEGLTYIDTVSQHEPDHCNFNEDDINIVLNWIDSVFK